MIQQKVICSLRFQEKGFTNIVKKFELHIHITLGEKPPWVAFLK